MNLLRANNFKVGVLVLSISALIAYMSMQVSEDPNFFGRNNEAWFMLPDAAGLVKNSAVKTAGIAVGTIQEITLQDGVARITLSLRPDVKIYTSAEVIIRSQGILGDKYIDIKPGSATDAPLEKGGQIFNVKDSGSLDSVVTKINELGGSLKETVEILKDSVSKDGNREHVLGRIVLNIEKLTADLSDMTSVNREKINDIVDQVHSVTGTLDEILNDETDEGFKAQFKRSMARLDSSLKSVDEIAAKINNGEGTIGKLINDESTVEELNVAIDGVNNFLDTASKTQTGLDFKTEYLGQLGVAKTSVGLKIQPGLDRYYYIGIVDDPAGILKQIDTRTTSGGSTTLVEEEKTYKSEFKFNVQFAKNFYDFTVRGGLIESSGGVGLDYNFFRQKMRFTVEAFQFSKLNLRAQLQYNIYKGIYVAGGLSDISNNSQKRSSYLGAGLFLTNDDLKSFLGSIPLTK